MLLRGEHYLIRSLHFLERVKVLKVSKQVPILYLIKLMHVWH